MIAFSEGIQASLQERSVQRPRRATRKDGVNLHLYARVIWRRRGLVATGVILGALLAFLSAYRVDFDARSVEPRQTEQWKSLGTLRVTQTGLPELRATFPVETGQGASGSTTPQFSDPARFAAAAPVIARLIESDGVDRLLLQDGVTQDDDNYLTAEAEQLDQRGGFLPIIRVAAIATSADGAIANARSGIRALRSFFVQEQAAAGIVGRERIVLRPLWQPAKAEVVRERSLTSPIILFVGMVVGTLVLAMALENVRSDRSRQIWVDDGRHSDRPSPGTARDRDGLLEEELAGISSDRSERERSRTQLPY